MSLKATVAISCYNQEKYIRAAIESVLSQEVNFDFDILIADDCSKDGTIKVLQEISSQSPQIKLILREQNVGAAKNYLDLHARAEGEIIFHLDGDDVMLPTKMQQQFETFENNPQVNIVFHRAEYFDDKRIRVLHTGFFERPAKVIISEESKLAQLGTIAVHSSYAYRKSSRKTKQLNREFMEWFFAMDSVLPKGKFAYINEILVSYRFNPQVGSYTSTYKGRKKAYTLYFIDLIYYFKKYPHLRAELYANALVSSIAMTLNGKVIMKFTLFFLIKNLIYFRFGKFIETLKFRRALSPRLQD